MCVCVCVHVCVCCIYACVCVHACVWGVCVCLHLCVRCVYVYMFVGMCVYECVCMCNVCVCSVSVHLYMFVCVVWCTHVHVYVCDVVWVFVHVYMRTHLHVGASACGGQRLVFSVFLDCSLHYLWIQALSLALEFINQQAKELWASACLCRPWGEVWAWLLCKCLESKLGFSCVRAWQVLFWLSHLFSSFSCCWKALHHVTPFKPSRKGHTSWSSLGVSHLIMCIKSISWNTEEDRACSFL